ncbi:hypothetical protein HYS94_01595 [Candidatus Daviesbacteria bacterium]|nr:hypothetical protein [Candidatus Daviesbacteria bacterium]
MKKKLEFDDRLLIPGWAGELGDDELGFILQKLKENRRLRKKWGFKIDQKTFRESKIRKVAYEGIGDYTDEG